MRAKYLVLTLVLVLIGCATEVDITITNNTGHDEIYVIFTYDSGQEARDLNDGDFIFKTIPHRDIFQ